VLTRIYDEGNKKLEIYVNNFSRLKIYVVRYDQPVLTACLSLFAVQVEKSKGKRNARKSATISLLLPWLG
jgi:hypothetical protein